MTKTIKNLLNPENDALSSILTRITQISQWNTWLAKHLPDEKKLLEHCQIVRYEQCVLYVIADNPHWSTRFKFFIPQLMNEFKRYPEFIAIKNIQCKTRPFIQQR